MKTLKVLLVASTALAMAGTTSPALARTKVSSAKSNIQQTLDAQKAEIDALKAQLETLQQQVTAQSAAQQDAQSQSQAASAQAVQAASTAEEAKAAAAQAQTAATSAEAAADKVKGDSSALAKAVSWAGDTKISGRMYFNASNISREVNGVKSATDNGTGFNIKRFYVGIDHQFSNVLSGNITTDVSQVSGVGQTLYIKKAYLDAKLDKALDIKLGATDMPWIPYAEGIYGYRQIEQTLIDRTKFGTSSDWGIHFMGDFANGLLSYQVSVVDGGGYRNPQFTKTIDLEGRLSLQYKGINAAIGGYTGKLGKDVQGATTPHTASRFNALLAYKAKKFTVGGEYFHASEWNQVTSATADSSDGFSLFGNVKFAPKWSAFGKYEWVKPNKDVNNAFKDEYFNFGIQYSPAKIVDLALVYKRDRAENGAISTGNGVIGCNTGATTSCTGAGTYDEIGLFGQFRF